MSIISIGIPLPDRSALPGQTGSGEEVNLQYTTQNYCKAGGTTHLPTVATPSGGVFSSSDNVGLAVVPSTGLFNVGVSDPGNYTITYTVAGVGSANFPINIGAVINTTITGDSATCIGSAPSPADLTAVSGYSNYEWFKDNVSVQNGASNTYTPAFNVAGSFVYKVTITDNSLGVPCTATSSNFTFTVNALPTISISTPGGAEGFCAGSGIVITASPSSGTFAWYKDGTVISGATGYQYTASTAGEYKAAVTDANGCTSALSNGIDLEEFDSPSVTIATVPGAVICTGDTATLTANPTGGSGSFTYSWNTSATTQAISVTTTGNYTVIVTDSNGCTATASQVITASTAATTIASIDNDHAMSFNGTDQYITAPNSSIFNLTNYSFSFWVNNAVLNTGTQVQGLVTCDTTASRGWLIFQYAQELRIAQAGVNQINVANFFTTNNTWIHVGVTYDGTNFKVYKDGSFFIGSTQSSGAMSLSSNGNDLTIGYNAHLSGRFFEGKLDEVAIFNSTLSSCDVKGIYEATTTVAGQPKSANLLDANTTIPAPVYWNRMGDS